MSDYYALVTTTGLAKLAALPVGGTLTLTHMAFGNSTIDPTEDMTALHSEQHRCALLNVEVESTNPNNLAAEAVIDSTVGGFWIREVGIYVIEPAVLKKAEGATLLPHVYNTEKQSLCLFYGRIGEWNASMFLSRTIVPWASEWLNFYELWVITGEWLGGGINHSRY